MKLFKISMIVVLLLSIYSCKKNQLGGKATLKGRVLHHSKPIPNAIIYIKYNATEFPGSDYKLYDTSVEADASGNYNLALYKGSYYIYASGLDLDISAPFKVVGGLSISIRSKEKLTKDIAVTE